MKKYPKKGNSSKGKSEINPGKKRSEKPASGKPSLRKKSFSDEEGEVQGHKTNQYRSGKKRSGDAYSGGKKKFESKGAGEENKASRTGKFKSAPAHSAKNISGEKRKYEDKEGGKENKPFKSKNYTPGTKRAGNRDYRADNKREDHSKKEYRKKDSSTSPLKNITFGKKSGSDKNSRGPGKLDKRDKKLTPGTADKKQSPPSYDFKKIKERQEKSGINKRTAKPDAEHLIRLNKYIANAGVCSRRDADMLIQSGEIKVNDKIITEMGHKVSPTDVVKYKNKTLSLEKLVYVLLNKPKDFITTTDDPEDRKTVMQLVGNACDERIYPVGRLDRNTTGLIILTNDGALAEKLSHPSHQVKKLYQVDLNKPITDEDFLKIEEGVVLEDGVAKVDEIGLVTPERTSLGLEIHIGRNRIVRRIFEHLGYEVVRLDRVMYAGLTKKDLSRGQWRYLNEKEVVKLKLMK